MLKLTKTLIHHDLIAKIYFDPEWDEFVAKFRCGGTPLEGCDYHTDDRDDAIDTAKFEMDRYATRQR